MGDGSGTALWFGAPEYEALAVVDDGVEQTVEVQTVAWGGVSGLWGAGPVGTAGG